MTPPSFTGRLYTAKSLQRSCRKRDTHRKRAAGSVRSDGS
ncbi:hypothetical protein HMPREF3036_02145 [Sutterella sp. KLE1602]|nr:hypothetical protein HMPREF3036_02145 [Sutterella sp. KLE1602]